MKNPAIMVTAALTLALAACDSDTARLDAMVGAVQLGQENANWSPIPDSDGAAFDMSSALEIREGIGITLRATPYTTVTPEDVDGPLELDGILTAVSSSPDVVDIFSADVDGFGLLARKAGTATIRFSIAGYPGTFDAPVTVTSPDAFVPVDEIVDDPGATTSSATTSSATTSSATTSGSSSTTTSGSGGGEP